MAPPSARHFECVLIDLDDCLYPRGTGLDVHCRELIQRHMVRTVGHLLGEEESEAPGNLGRGGAGQEVRSLQKRAAPVDDRTSR